MRISNNPDIAVETPLVFSKYLSDIISCSVYLKLENTQPSGSFKMRGISALCKKKVQDGCTKLVGSSGGNAGVALAYSAYQLKVPCQLFVPTYVSPLMVKKIKAYGAEVTIVGHDWQVANEAALKLAASDPKIGFIHPYDHPEIWNGYLKIVEEIQTQLRGVKPRCIATSVGGGGLLTGILKALDKTGWKDVPVLAMETVGSECFNKSIKAGRIVEITLTSVAKSLGARSVAPTLMEIQPNFNIVSEVLPDREAVSACLKFADDHGYIVEPACGVTLASVYSKLLPNVLNEAGHTTEGPIVLIVCGGSDLTSTSLRELGSQFGLIEKHAEKL